MKCLIEKSSKILLQKKIECHGLIEKMIKECQNFGEK